MDIEVNRLDNYGKESENPTIAYFKYEADGTKYELVYDNRLGDNIFCSVDENNAPLQHDSAFPNLYCPNFAKMSGFVANKPASEIAEIILGWEKMSPMGFRNEEGDMTLLFGIDQVKYIGNIDEYIVWDEYEDEDGFEKIWAAIIEFCKDIKCICEKHQK